MKLKELKPAEGCHVFSGYYDKSPFDAGNQRHLALQVGFFDRMPDGDDVAEVGYFDLETNSFHKLDETTCFNWQQGAMLQWLGPDYSNRVIFNRREGDRFQSRIIDLDTGARRDLSRAIYAVRPQGDKALGIDFARHYWCRRGYAYGGVEDHSKKMPIVPGDEIYLLDLNTNKTEAVIDLESLLEFKPASSMSGATHYLEHVMFADSGDRFMFFHRWKSDGGGIYARLYVADIENPKPRLVLDSGRLSHACWVGEDTILAWAAPESALGSFRKSRLVKGRLGAVLRPIYRALVSGNPKHGQTRLSRHLNGDSYLLIPAANGSSSRAQPVCVETLDRDGHPTAFRKTQNLFLTDTYPDLKHQAKVIVANYANGKIKEIARLNSLPTIDDTAIRCDLHPKLSLDEKLVSVDTVHEGYRSIFVYQIDDGVASINYPCF